MRVEHEPDIGLRAAAATRWNEDTMQFDECARELEAKLKTALFQQKP